MKVLRAKELMKDLYPILREILEIEKEASERRYQNQTIRVFVSSTFMDLSVERQAVKKAIERCGCVPKLAEEADMQPGKSLVEQISYWLRDIHVLILLISERYGELGPFDISWTEEEVRKAVKQGIIIIPYIIKREIPAGIELDSGQRARLNRFKEYLKNLPDQQPPQYPADTIELVLRVSRDLGGLQCDHRIQNIVSRMSWFVKKQIEEEEQESYDNSFVN